MTVVLDDPLLNAGRAYLAQQANTATVEQEKFDKPESEIRTDFENRALPLIARGVPVVWIPARTKAARLSGWQQLASTDTAQIKEWARTNPDANVASVAKAQPGGVWFLDADRAGLAQQIEQQTGQKFPNTFMVRSQKGKGHYYFRQTPASIAMGNRQQSDEHGELWSARVDDRYVVGPGSIHPDTGTPYEVINDAAIVEAPQWLIDWCVAQTEDKPAKTGNTKDNDEPISQGARNSTLASIGGKARQVLEMDKEELFQFLWSQNLKRCQPPLSESEVRTIANSIGRYKIALSGPQTVLLGGNPVGQQIEASAAIEIENEPINPSESVSNNSLDYLPSGCLASTRLQDIFMEYFQPHDWPLTLALPALVTAASVIVPPPRQDGLIIGDSMTNLYTALIADVNAGKSQVINWAASAIGIYEPPLGNFYFEGKFGSAEQMLKSLHRKQSHFTNKSVLINPDEWAHLFSKAAIPDASFPTVLTSSFYRRNQIFTLGGPDGGKEYNVNLAMSFISGIVESEFDTVFGANSLGGLYDRFLFGRAPDGFKWNYVPCPIEPKKYFMDWNLKPVQINGSVFEVLRSWGKQNPGLGRIAEVCSRVAAIYGCIDGRPEITGKDIEPLKPLALYQVGLRQIFRPNPGTTPDAIFANKALAWINKHGANWVSISRLKQHLYRVEERLGPNVAERALMSLARGGRIDLWLANGEDNPPSDYRGPKVRIGLVRRVR
jgi:hypothetical protein